ncbi:MAG: S8 family serine peptidase [Lachnospiraceae bacterium]|nr:S8 family serine peptidase [Lachnospiraceae bacterium]
MYRSKKLFVSVLLILSMIAVQISTTNADENMSRNHQVAIGESLLEIMGLNEAALRSGCYARSDEVFTCIIWLNEINYETPIRMGLAEAEKAHRATNGNIDLPYTLFYDDVTKELQIDFDVDADYEFVQTYIETKRAVAKQMYLDQNVDFSERVLGGEVDYISGYSPCVFASLSADQITDLLDSEEITLIDYYSDNEPVNDDEEDGSLTSTDISNLHSVKMYDTNINITKQLYNVSGANVKIGQLEMGCPTSSNVTRYADLSYGNTAQRTHADNVYTIMHEIAPNSTYYATGIKDQTGAYQYYQAMEWLLGQGVNVINISMSFSVADALNTYDTQSRWTDHIAFNHDVHVVKSAGNEGDNGVTVPGMANNVITVGNVEDNHHLNSISSYNTGGSSSSSKMCKPDIVAPGCFPSGRFGTSYSTPMVTATIALIGSKWSSMLTKQHLVKTALVVGTSATCGRYCTLQTEFRQYGAGVLDARYTFYIINNNRYVSLGQVSSSETTKTYTLNISSTSSIVRVGLTYTNRIVFPAGGGTLLNPHPDWNTPSGTIGNLSIEVRSPSNVQVDNITWQYANVKILHINPAIYGTGTYTIIVKQITSASGGRPTKFSLSWR